MPKLKFLTDLPWKAAIKTGYAIRRHVAEVPKPEPHRVITGVDTEDLRRRLLVNNHETNKFSYYYKGEDLNLRIPMGRPDHKYEAWQYHIRAWDAGDLRVETRSHFEPSPFQHPKIHLLSNHVQEGRGIQKYSQLFKDEGLKFDLTEVGKEIV